jgi:hypothetical protein
MNTTRWSGRHGKGEMRIRRADKRAEAEERNARHRTEIARIAADHNISEREARRIYAGRYPMAVRKAELARRRAA